jgi:hypothetical protein
MVAIGATFRKGVVVSVLDEESRRIAGLRLPRPRTGDTAAPAARGTDLPGRPAAVSTEVASARFCLVVRVARRMRALALALTVGAGLATAAVVIMVAGTAGNPSRPVFLIGLGAILAAMVTAGVLGCLGQAVEFLARRAPGNHAPGPVRS